MLVTIHMQTLNAARASLEKSVKDSSLTCLFGCDLVDVFTSIFCVELSPLCYYFGNFVGMPWASGRPETELLSVK